MTYFPMLSRLVETESESCYLLKLHQLGQIKLPRSSSSLRSILKYPFCAYITESPSKNFPSPFKVLLGIKETLWKTSLLIFVYGSAIYGTSSTGVVHVQ